jgi:beta-lactamase superfamily II metal-dependent hydrolase
MKKYFVLAVALGFLFTFGLFAQQLEIHHIDVGQADATLIKSPTGVTMLIDAGNDGNGTNIVRPYLTSLGITYLNYIVCSHYHADHLGGLDEIISSFGASNIGAIYDRGSDAPLPTTTAYNNYVSAANATGKRYKVALGQNLDLGGGVTMQCVATDGEVINYGVVPGATGSENDLSVGWKLNYSSFQYFTGGDLGGETTYYGDSETPLAPQVGDVDAMKINHHGSQYSTNQTFVNALKPEVSFIEVGNGNTYGHPTQAVLNRLAAANCYIYQTETGAGGTIPSGKGVVANGNIVLKTSGTSYTVTYGTTTNTYPGDGGADVTPPVISAVTASSITSSSAVITWTTDEASNSVVDYGLTTSYGSTVTNSTMVTSHSVSLTGLSASTLYHYRVKSTDAANNTATSSDYTFTTSAPPVSKLIESFTDGNFTANPAWGGTTTNWQIITSSDVAAGATNSYTLRLNVASAVSGTQYLSTQRTSAWGTSQSWSFWMGRRAQAATNANHSIVWLWANESNLTSSTVDGYRIRFGDDSRGDNIVLQRVTNGVATDILTSSGAITNGLTDIGFMVRVIRTSSSAWTVYTSTLPTATGSGAVATAIPSAANTTVSQGSVTNSTYTNFASGYFGFMAVHSSGTSARTGAEFDQLYFDTTSSSPLGKPAFSPEIASRPSDFSLQQNYPNPFNPTTTFRYELAADARVQFIVFDVVGREVATILNGEQQPSGIHDLSFDASSLASGVYYYRLIAQPAIGNTYIETRKFMLLK